MDKVNGTEDTMEAVLVINKATACKNTLNVVAEFKVQNVLGISNF